MVGAAELSLLPQDAVVVNTARGPILDLDALMAAMECGRIAGAGLDVLSVEPPVDGSPLQQAPNCFITPHIAWATRAAREEGIVPGGGVALLRAQAVLDADGDYFFQLKKENRHAYKAALQKANTPPFLPTPKSPTAATDA